MELGSSELHCIARATKIVLKTAKLANQWPSTQDFLWVWSNRPIIVQQGVPTLMCKYALVTNPGYRVLARIKKPNGYLSQHCQYYIFQCGHIRLCHLKAWPADDYLYTCVNTYLMLKAKWSIGKLNPNPEENQMECSIQKQPSENPAWVCSQKYLW